MPIRTPYFFTLIVLLCGAFAAYGQQPAAGETLTLDQALTLALGGNRGLQTAGIEVDKYTDRAAALKSQRLPQIKFSVLGSQLLTKLDYTFERGVFGNYAGVGEIPDKNVTISTPRRPTMIINGQISQPISQLYRLGLNLKQLNTGRAIAEQQAQAQRLAVVNNVRRGYYAILQTQSALAAAEESIKLYTEMDRVTTEYVAQRVALKSEHLDVQARLAKSEYDASTLRDQLASQKEQLNQVLGRAIGTEFVVSEAPEYNNFEMDLAAARRQAVEQRPEIEEARLKVKQSDYDRRIKKSEYIPEVSLAFNYYSPRNINFVPKHDATIGVMVTWEPFDWGRKRHELAEKVRQTEQARISLRDVESSVLLEVNDRYRKLQQTRQLLGVVRLAQEAAREQVRVMTNRYSAQAAMLKDLLQAQTALADAHHQHQEALLAFWTAKADFQKAIGERQ